MCNTPYVFDSLPWKRKDFSCKVEKKFHQIGKKIFSKKVGKYVL